MCTGGLGCGLSCLIPHLGSDPELITSNSQGPPLEIGSSEALALCFTVLLSLLGVNLRIHKGKCEFLEGS